MILFCVASGIVFRSSGAEARLLARGGAEFGGVNGRGIGRGPERMGNQPPIDQQIAALLAQLNQARGMPPGAQWNGTMGPNVRIPGFVLQMHREMTDLHRSRGNILQRQVDLRALHQTAASNPHLDWYLGEASMRQGEYLTGDIAQFHGRLYSFLDRTQQMSATPPYQMPFQYLPQQAYQSGINSTARGYAQRGNYVPYGQRYASGPSGYPGQPQMPPMPRPRYFRSEEAGVGVMMSPFFNPDTNAWEYKEKYKQPISGPSMVFRKEGYIPGEGKNQPGTLLVSNFDTGEAQGIGEQFIRPDIYRDKVARSKIYDEMEAARAMRDPGTINRLQQQIASMDAAQDPMRTTHTGRYLNRALNQIPSQYWAPLATMRSEQLGRPLTPQELAYMAGHAMQQYQKDLPGAPQRPPVPGVS